MKSVEVYQIPKLPLLRGVHFDVWKENRKEAT